MSTTPPAGVAARAGEAAGRDAARLDALDPGGGWAWADAAVRGGELRLRWDGPEGWVELRLGGGPGAGRPAVRRAEGVAADTPADRVAAAAAAWLAERLAARPGVGWGDAQAAGARALAEAADAGAARAVLAAFLGADGAAGGGWRLVDAAPRAGACELAFRHPEAGAPLHVVVVPPGGEGPPGGDGPGEGGGPRISDFLGGPGPAPASAPVRARVALALVLAGLEGAAPGGGGLQGAAPSGGRVRLEAAGEAPAPLEPPRVLTDDDLAAFARDGYLVVHDAVPPALVDACLAAIRWFLALDPTLTDEWFYEVHPYRNLPGFQRTGCFLELYQHQALWDVRQHPAVWGVFAALWGRPDLWVSMDRVNVKPPAPRAPDLSWRDPGRVHWDVEIEPGQPLPFGVQGMVALSHATEREGTWRCAPGMHRHIEAWARAQPPGCVQRYPPDRTFETVPVTLRPGDLLVWHHALPHGSGPSFSERPRIVQYLTMEPARPDNAQARLRRVRAWRERLPGGEDFEGDPLGREAAHGTTAALTPLGRRLLGLDPW